MRSIFCLITNILFLIVGFYQTTIQVTSHNIKHLKHTRAAPGQISFDVTSDWVTDQVRSGQIRSRLTWSVRVGLDLANGDVYRVLLV